MPTRTRTSDHSRKNEIDENDHGVANRGDNANERRGDPSQSAAAFPDPSVCDIQLSLHTAKLPEKGMTTPVKKTNRRSLSEIDDRVVATDEAIVVANIDGNYFQIDLNQLLGIVVGPGVTESDHSSRGSNAAKEAGDGSKEKHAVREIPAFLLLEFPSCCFRLFSQTPLAFHSPSDDETTTGTHDSTEERDGNRARFDAVRQKLLSVLSIDCLLPFPLSYSGLTTRSGTDADAEAAPKLRGENYGSKHDPISCARRCLRSYSRSWMDLISFDDALENPIASRSSIGSAEKNNFKETVNRFMTGIPKHVASSFIEEDKWAMALESYNDKICAKMQAFENLIDDFWTETSENGRNPKRRRLDEDLVSDESLDKNGCIKRYEELLREHKRHMVSRHELYLLPSRG
eukprot:jgi/Psemu1/308169/fgenesh1_kg.385_\